MLKRAFVPSWLVPSVLHTRCSPRQTGRQLKAISQCRPLGTAAMEISFLSAEQAKMIDDQLMGPMGFSVDQLMELAGLSVACAIQKEYPPQRVLIVCGPGNNGGDGLVAARHLTHFGFDVSVLYPVRKDVKLYNNLVMQCQDLGIPILDSLPNLASWPLVVDAIFGFSFAGAVRAPFQGILQELCDKAIPVVSIDIPSGWNVDGGAPAIPLQPQMLVSLTAPKKCAEAFTGMHYVGGRFVSPAFAAKHHIALPKYPGAEQCVRVDRGPQSNL
eukprot:GGOE01044260.1.p2 GENE.GGOE01044260.1~~GGOE01044260.1.p2  ORF type:complete len:272 (+),score=78.88 GGOE01044260.1:228-1043(+)